MKYFHNSSWMISEYIIKLFATFFVSIYIARYLGPKDFGLLSYIITIVFFFMALSRLAMETTLVRELVKVPEKKHESISTAFFLMLGGSISSILIANIFVHLFETDPVIKHYVFILSTVLIFQPFFVIDYNFQANLKAKYPSIAKSIALFLSSIFKIVLVYYEFDFIYILIAYILDFFLMAFFLYVFSLSKGQVELFTHFNFVRAKSFLSSSLPLVLSSLSMYMFTMLDKLMIKQMIGIESLGYYSASTKIYEGWMFIPIITSASLFPLLIKSKNESKSKYKTNLIRIFSFITWLGLLIAIISTIFREEIIFYLFGSDFNQANTSLPILMWAAAFIGMGTISYKYFSMENLEKKFLMRAVISLVTNLPLNLWLIPKYGINGAATSTLISVIISYYIVDYFDPDTKELFRIKNAGILMPFSRILRKKTPSRPV